LKISGFYDDTMLKGHFTGVGGHAGFVEILNVSILKLINYRITPADTYTTSTTVNEITERDKYRPLNKLPVSGEGKAAE
jgi:hypothetical protein